MQNLFSTRTHLSAHLVVFLGYFWTAKLGLYLLANFHTSPALIWAPAGIALAAVIFWGYEMAVPIFLAQFFSVYTQPNSAFLLDLFFALGYTVQSVSALYILRRLKFTPEFDKLRNTIIFIAISFLVTVIAPTINTVAQILLHSLAVPALLTWTRAWGANVFSVLVLTPFLTTWSYRKDRYYTRREKIETIAAFALLTITIYFLFWTPFPKYFGIAVIFFLPAVLIWFALRLQVRWMTFAFLITSVFGIIGTISQRAVATAPLNVQLLSDEVYIGLVAAIFIVFIAVVEERRAASKGLEEAYATMFEADKAKTEFIAILAHELRNPLAPIVSSLELLKMQPQNPISLKTIQNAQEHTVMISRILDDLLDTARLTQKKFVLKKEVVVLGDVVEQSVESVADFYAERNHTLSVNLSNPETLLYADPVRFKQIIINLLTNAGKYTKRGGRIELAINNVQDFTLIRVSDNGIGIEPTELPHIFEPFIQTDMAATRGTGLGIGLFLTKNLVEMHGGKIDAWSDGVGSGSTFRVYLPLAKNLSRPQPAKDRPLAPRPSRARILIIDDNEAAAVMMQKLLSHHGHDVTVSFSGQAALPIVSTFNPEFVLLDLGMPDMDGYEVARRLREGAWSGMIVAMTGYGQESDRIRSQEAGFDHHLVKPVRSEQIITLLNTLQNK